MSNKKENNSVTSLLERIRALLSGGITTTIAAGDIEIGAVEIKNGTDDTRATVNGSNALLVAQTGALPAGTNNIGDVDVLSVTAAAATNKTDIGLINAVTPLMGNGASGTGALRVALVNDGTGRMATLDTLTSGNVGGFTTLVQSTVVMSVAGAYATGDYMGTSTAPQSFASAVRTSGGTGVIKSVLISDKIVTANVAMELWILDRTYTAPTDNAAWDLSDTNMLFVQAVIPISTTGWYASSAGQVYMDGTLSIPIKSNGTTLFYALVARGTTPAFTSADLTITLGILQD
jgi:hypothetical protein